VKSIGARLAFWYAFASTATFACLFLGGRYFLEKHAIHALELLNAAEFEQIRPRLGADYATLTPAEIEERLRETTEFSSVLFYLEIHRRGTGPVFRSRNLKGQSIPDKPGSHYNAVVGDLGELRVSEFILEPMEIMIATSKRHVRGVMQGYERVFAGLMLVMLLVSGAVGYVLSRFALRPVRLIQETAARIGSDNLGERIPVPAVQDEISNLARLLNQMFDRLEAAFNQTRRFTAEASHELKTPLSLVRLQAEKLALEGGLKPAQEEAVHMQLEEIARLNQIIEELLFLSRAEARAVTLQTKSQDPRPFLASFGADAQVLAEARGARFEARITGEGTATFDAKWIRQVLLNLMANALNVSPAGGKITLTSELDAAIWRVALEDEGPGVPAEQRGRIFERFVRLGNGTEAGSGLGLAISRSIVSLHRGTIHAEAGGGGKGLRVAFELPVGAE
jgi:two-component system heavy metal sensor histidine kinase CusS